VKNTPHVIRLDNGGLWREVVLELLHKSYNVVLLLAGGVDICKEQNLRVAAGHGKDAAGIIALGISLLFFLIGCIPSLLAAVNGFVRNWRLVLGGGLLPGFSDLISGLVHLLW
jgi:hypothetical protein